MDLKVSYKERYFDLRNKYNDIIKDLKSVTSLWSKQVFDNNVTIKDQVIEARIETYSFGGWEHYNTVKLSQLEATTYYELENRLVGIWQRKGIEARITVEYDSGYKGNDSNNYFELSFDGIEFTFDYNFERLGEDQ